MQGLPPLASFQTLAGLDAFSPASYHTMRHSIAAYPPPAYPYQDEQPEAYMPSALSGTNLALHDALTNAFLSAQFHQQRPPSPESHYPLRWPEADSYPQYTPGPQAEPSLTASSSFFPQSYSVAPQSTYQSLQDAHSAASRPAWSVSGSLDPVTGIFQHMPEHPRVRTAQACEKCRARKAKVRLPSPPSLACPHMHPYCSAVASILRASAAVPAVSCASTPQSGGCGDPIKRKEMVTVSSTSTKNGARPSSPPRPRAPP